MTAQHTALAITDRLIRLALADDAPMNPVQLQKTTYFCHAWHLGLGFGALFQDAVESWQYGPVIRAVYHTLKDFGKTPVTAPILEEEDGFTSREHAVINAVYQQYGHLEGVRLCALAHGPGSPWEITHNADPRTQIIPDHLIRQFYAQVSSNRVQS